MLTQLTTTLKRVHKHCITSSKQLAEKKLSDTYEQLDVPDPRVVAKQAITNAEQEQFARLRTTQITNDIAKDQLITPDTSSQETSVGNVLGSAGIGLLKGAISLPDMAVTLAEYGYLCAREYL